MSYLLKTIEIWLFCFGLVVFFMYCGFLLTQLPYPFKEYANLPDTRPAVEQAIAQAGHLK